jgi:IS605 OrfB family transposase
VKATFSQRIRDESVYPALIDISEHLSHVGRHLFVDRYVRRNPLTKCKKEYVARFGITARQFNGLSMDLDAIVSSIRRSAHGRVRRLAARAARLGKWIERQARRLARERDPRERGRIRFVLHQKKRHLHIIQTKLERARQEGRRRVPRVCFGSRKLFRAQSLAESGYSSRGRWLADWKAARARGFFCPGSRDEKSGNQTATLLPGGLLRLRVPPALEAKHGRWVLVRGVCFPYGQEVIDRALLIGQPITFRFFRRKRKGKWVWYVQATVERPEAPVLTRRDLGALGVDFNPGIVAASRIDRCGNPVAAREYPADLEGKSREQRAALLGDIVADIIAWAKSEGVPVVIERLDFEKKKAAVREMGAGSARMLSRFDTHRFHGLLHSRAAREGVEVIVIDPEYTTVIGWYKFAAGYQLSVHAAAAVAIARRGLGFGETLRSRSGPGGPEGSASPLPVRNRGEHVWMAWERLRRRLRRSRRGRRPHKGGRMRGIPLSAGGTCQGPPRDGSPSGPGERQTPAQTVGSAVRPAGMVT